MKNRVYIDSRCQILYSSYYILGLYEKYGKENVKFGNNYFKLLSYSGRSDFDQFFAFVVIDNQSQKLMRCIVDYGDQNYISESAYIWTDVYAKINICKDYVIFREKLLSIPPSFGIKIYNKYQNRYIAIANLIKCFFNRPVSIKTFIGSYNACAFRQPIANYLSISKDEQQEYVFFASTLWSHQECIDYTNPLRYSFMKAAKSSVEMFEGGFISKNNSSEASKYEDMLSPIRVKPSEYILKIKKSLFVFNTPAVHNCHGWKLGEFLAMGKAIISTPLSNKLPGELKHNEHILIVNTTVELTNAIEKLKDRIFREKLQKNSKIYYENYASPQAVINLIVNSGKQ